MTYTPENNPYIPGDPYSYDLKWIVDELKTALSLYQPLHDEFTALNVSFDELHDYVMDYFANLDVNDEISAKLDQMAADGSLSALIQPLFNAYKAEISGDIAAQNEAISVLRARMDTFASLAEGSTTGDAELQDIRVGYNGTTYSTAGDAVRTQIANLHTDINYDNALFSRCYREEEVTNITWTQGSINFDSGATFSTDDRIRTSIGGSCDILKVKCPANIQITAVAYKHVINTANYLGRLNPAFLNPNYSGYIVINIVKGLRYALIARYADGSNILPDAGADITVYKCFNANANDTNTTIDNLIGDRPIIFRANNTSWIRGTIREADGTEASSDYVIRTIDMIPIKASLNISINNIPADFDVAFAYFYAADLSYIKRLDLLTGAITVPYNAAYVRFTAGHTTASAIVINDAIPLLDQISYSIDTVSDNADDPFFIPEYYFENDYLPGRINKILGLMSTSDINHSDDIIWFTDPHFWRRPGVITNGMRGVALIKYIQEHVNIKKIFQGGDLMSQSDLTAPECTELISAYREYMAPLWANTYNIIGNHEWNNPTSTEAQEVNMLTAPQIYDQLIKDKEGEFVALSYRGDYCFDNRMQKIRYFCIGANPNASLAANQIKWLGAELLNVPAGYTVIVLSHLGLEADGTWATAMGNVYRILDAANTKTSVTYVGSTFDYSNTDFTVACVLSGHIHRDISARTDGGIPIIATICDRGPTASSSEGFNDARKYGTINEQAIDVVHIDTLARTISLVRIGGSYDGSAPLIDPDRVFTY